MFTHFQYLYFTSFQKNFFSFFSSVFLFTYSYNATSKGSNTRPIIVNHAEEWRLHMRRSNVVTFSAAAVAGLIHLCLPQKVHRRSGKNDQRPLIRDDNGNALWISTRAHFAGLWSHATGCQTCPPWVVLPGI